MPKVTWEELNDIIHRTKNAVTKISKVELEARKVKREILSELDELHKIVLKQVNGK